MELILTRTINNDGWTIGQLTVDGKYVCDVIEDKDRGLESTMPVPTILQIKQPSRTAIPSGTYKIVMDVVSPKFSQYKYYSDYCDGLLPRLVGVPGYDGILIHGAVRSDGTECDATADWTAGCLITCKYDGVNDGREKNSKKMFEKLYSILKEAKDPITITIKRNYQWYSKQQSR